MRKGDADSDVGPERVIARLLPQALAGGSITPLIAYYCFSHSGPLDPAALGIALYMALGMVLATWMGVLAVAIGCLAVRIAKGPARYADAYPLPDVERPPMRTSRR